MRARALALAVLFAPSSSSPIGAQQDCPADGACMLEEVEMIQGVQGVYSMTPSEMASDTLVPASNAVLLEPSQQIQATYVEGTCFAARPDFGRKFQAERDAQAACLADAACKGYYRWEDGQYIFLVQGQDSVTAGTPDARIKSVQVKQAGPALMLQPRKRRMPRKRRKRRKGKRRKRKRNKTRKGRKNTQKARKRRRKPGKRRKRRKRKRNKTRKGRKNTQKARKRRRKPGKRRKRRKGRKGRAKKQKTLASKRKAKKRATGARRRRTLRAGKTAAMGRRTIQRRRGKKQKKRRRRGKRPVRPIVLKQNAAKTTVQTTTTLAPADRLKRNMTHAMTMAKENFDMLPPEVGSMKKPANKAEALELQEKEDTKAKVIAHAAEHLSLKMSKNLAGTQRQGETDGKFQKRMLILDLAKRNAGLSGAIEGEAQRMSEDDKEEANVGGDAASQDAAVQTRMAYRPNPNQLSGAAMQYPGTVSRLADVVGQSVAAALARDAGSPSMAAAAPYSADFAEQVPFASMVVPLPEASQDAYFPVGG